MGLKCCVPRPNNDYTITVAYFDYVRMMVKLWLTLIIINLLRCCVFWFIFIYFSSVELIEIESRLSMAVVDDFDLSLKLYNLEGVKIKTNVLFNNVVN